MRSNKIQKKVVLSSLLISSLFSACASVSTLNQTESNHNAAQYSTVDTCSNAIVAPVSDDFSAVFNSDKITVISWNIEKGHNTGWKRELKDLAKDAQLVLLQEAIFIDEMKDSSERAIYWSFSHGYKTQDYRSGIMTLSSIEPDVICSFQRVEPWLRSPKISSITRFQLTNSTSPLLVVNIHQINFTLGTNVFAQQLEDVNNILNAHQGPIILSGDFNSWSQARLNILNKMTTTLNLSPVHFSADYRRKELGHYLDHIFTRGFNVEESHTVEVDTSDHNPLITTLSLQKSSS
jgi:endonuclease/exonuclease/phosphatase (EEP) superfamily protein YafD